MKKFIVERALPGAGKLTPEELKAFAAKACLVINNLGVPYHWIHTFITDNKLYCVHIAPDRETVLKHACEGGFPVDNIAEIRTIIDPITSVIKVEKQP